MVYFVSSSAVSLLEFINRKNIDRSEGNIDDRLSIGKERKMCTVGAKQVKIDNNFRQKEISIGEKSWGRRLPLKRNTKGRR